MANRERREEGNSPIGKRKERAREGRGEQRIREHFLFDRFRIQDPTANPMVIHDSRRLSW